MSIIKKLSPETTQKIAAGQVVERPCHVLKELIENSLDAGATSITVSCSGGGHVRISVEDNGCGMDQHDMRLCFEPHATSKLSKIDDLIGLSTFGFRGEALASISAVSKVTLTCKRPDDLEGHELQCSAGVISQERTVSAPTGTRIIVEDIFYNVPARKKFLKKDATEWRQIVQLFWAFCYSYKNIHFKLFEDDRLVHNCPPVLTLLDRKVQLWEREAGMIPVLANQNGVALEGLISDHQYSRYDRNSIFIFVNGRWVKNYELSKALLKGYNNVLAAGKFPAIIMNITVDSESVDINSHPRKEEVRFVYPRRVETVLTEAVHQALQSSVNTNLMGATRSGFLASSVGYGLGRHLDADLWQSSAGYAHRSASSLPSYSEGAAFSEHRALSEERTSFERDMPVQSAPRRHIAGSTDAYVFSFDDLSEDRDAFAGTILRSSVSGILTTPDASSVLLEKQLQGEIDNPLQGSHATAQSENDFAQFSAARDSEGLSMLHSQHTVAELPTYTLIGQYAKTYLLLEHENGLMLVDQHAAHERILYERFAQRFGSPEMTLLMFPPVFTLTAHECDLINEHQELFYNHGLTLERTGPTQVSMTACATHLKDFNVGEFIDEVISWIQEYAGIDKAAFYEKIHKKIQAQMACKAAIKAGDELTHEAMQHLLQDLHRTHNRLTCPHGRPTSWLVTLDEIERKFKRRV